MREKTGEITVFLSLVLLLVLGLCGTCLESARSAGLKARVQMAAESALTSGFAGFDRDLWEQYGLLFYADTDRAGRRLGQTVLTYAEANSGGEVSGVDWFSFQPQTVEITSCILGTGAHGKVFQQAVSEYQKKCGAAVSAAELFAKWNIADGSGRLSEDGIRWKNQADSEETELSQIWKEYEKLKRQAEENPELPENSPDSTAEAGEDGIGMSRQEAEPMVKGIMEMIREIAFQGMLAFLVPDASSVSDKPLGGEELPSSLTEAEKGGEEWALIGSGYGNRLWTLEYVADNMKHYSPDTESPCQVEYVIAGKASDRKNLACVAGKIFGIRYLVNQGTALADAGKRKEAGMVAAAAVGWTGIPGIVEAMTALLLTALALGESVLDVRTLLAGGTIPLAKQESDWQISLKGFAARMGDFTCRRDTSAPGLSYIDYLRILLLFSDSEQLSYRSMDVIQQELCKKHPGFRFSRCIYAAEVVIGAEAESRFSYLPGHIEYELTGKARYGYYTGTGM